MKIKVSIYNDDEARNRDIQVIAFSVGAQNPRRTTIRPSEHDNMETFEIAFGDVLVVTVPGT